MLTAAPGPDQMAEARAVYAAAFGQAPYREDDQQVTAFSERVLRYAAERQGFRFITARDPGGRLTGLARAGRCSPTSSARPTASPATG